MKPNPARSWLSPAGSGGERDPTGSTHFGGGPLRPGGGVILLLAVWLSLVAPGIAAPAQLPSRRSQPSSLVWPPPPAPPRIAYVNSISRPADAGSKPNAWGRIANWITGASKGDESLVKPFAIALDEKDNLCLTDTGANVVCYLDRTKQKWFRWDKVGHIRFLAPVAIARRGKTFYVADSSLAAVVAFDDKAKLLFTITNGLIRPAGLDLAGQRLLVADSQRHCILTYDLAGRLIGQFGRRGTGPGEFNFPTHIRTDVAGEIYVTDSMNSRVQRFDAQGRYQNQIGRIGDSPGHFSRPKGIAVDTIGHVYVVDALFDNVQVFDRAGQFLLNLGEAGSRPGQFWLPNGIAISRRNEIFVADSYNRRVQVLQYIGQP